MTGTMKPVPELLVTEEERAEAALRSLHMETLGNARELGGLRNREGRVIRRGKLLRTAALKDASPEDLRRLTEELHLRSIVDFRSGEEQLEKPDPVPEGVRYLHLDVMDTSAFDSQDRKDAIERTEQRTLRDFAEEMLHMEATFDMSLFYGMMLQSEKGVAGFAAFFRELLSLEGGTILWHCSAGKDRTGIASALLLASLDCSEETILKEYLLTNVFNHSRFLDAQARVRALGFTEYEAYRVAGIMEGVEEVLLAKGLASVRESDGSVKGYLRRRLGLGEEDFRFLREHYLEEQPSRNL